MRYIAENTNFIYFRCVEFNISVMSYDAVPLLINAALAFLSDPILV